MAQDDPTLLALAIDYIDETIEKRRAERDDLAQQIAWLEAQRQQLLAEAAAPAPPPGRVM